MPVRSATPIGRVVVTGASGFIGTHLCRAVDSLQPVAAFGVDLVEPGEPSSCRYVRADVRSADELRRAGALLDHPEILIHLAATAEVVMPWDQIAPLLSSNMLGTYQVLTTLAPKLVVFTSTCSVYGTARPEQTDPARQSTLPLSLYGASKLVGEMIIGEWARTSGSSAVILRLGNVIGPGCRGLLTYLAQHVRRYPKGDVPARLRGHGRLIRDYVPVSYVVAAALAAARADVEPGTVVTVNVGTGRGMSNRDVVEVVQAIVQAEGYRLEATFDDPPESGEAAEIVLQPDTAVQRLGLAIPTPEAVTESIRASVMPWLQ